MLKALALNVTNLELPEYSKNGDLEPLRFPQFRQELLQQNFWSAADNLGRIKIIISEGFPRDSMTLPLERVKNVVAFSFQHAPLGKYKDGLLEEEEC